MATTVDLETAVRRVLAEFEQPSRPEAVEDDDVYYQIGGILLDDLKSAWVVQPEARTPPMSGQAHPDQATVRERIAKAIADRMGLPEDEDVPERQYADELAEAVLAALNEGKEREHERGV